MSQANIIQIVSETVTYDVAVSTSKIAIEVVKALMKVTRTDKTMSQWSFSAKSYADNKGFRVTAVRDYTKRR